MSFKVTGKIKKVLDKQEGLSKAGKQWEKQSFIVSNNDGYEGKEVIYCFEIFGGEKVKKFNDYNKVGDNVDVNFSISTNEYKGNYYTSLSAFSVFKNEDKVETPAPVFETIEKEDLTEVDDDLPF